MNSDIYKDQIHETADRIAFAMTFIKSTVLTPDDMDAIMKAVKAECDDIVDARIHQWHYRGY